MRRRRRRAREFVARSVRACVARTCIFNCRRRQENRRDWSILNGNSLCDYAMDTTLVQCTMRRRFTCILSLDGKGRLLCIHVLLDDRKQNDLCILLDIHAYKCIIYSAFPQSGSMWPFFNLSGPLRRKVLQLAVTLLHRSIQPQDTLSSTIMIV